MADEPCVCNTAFACMADEHDEPKDPLHRPTRYVRPTSVAPVDWPARFSAAAAAAERGGFPGTVRHLRSLAEQLDALGIGFPQVVEAIGRALLAETDETETAAELAGRDGGTTHG